ncbi:MAG TPA: hypothetical protein DER01_20145 [Phycisphaerales bacterium]|nr:hypothetical protein [Phycisphaerales bacterium]|tara:strand:- start:621 stop:824 length:204 start_codon:yes stop_codon:yes gene_type:complete
MKYTEYRDAIADALKHENSGLTWKQLRDQLDLPYNRPCPEWTRRLEQEIKLTRVKGSSRALIWMLEH